MPYDKKKNPVKKSTRKQAKHLKGRKAPGIGKSGGSARLTPSEERAIAKGLEGKKDMSTQKKHSAAISKEQAKSGEKKTSYTMVTKRKPKVATLDTRTGKRTTAKAKPSAAKKAALKRQKANVKAGQKAAKKVQRKR